MEGVDWATSFKSMGAMASTAGPKTEGKLFLAWGRIIHGNANLPHLLLQGSLGNFP